MNKNILNELNKIKKSKMFNKNLPITIHLKKEKIKVKIISQNKFGTKLEEI